MSRLKNQNMLRMHHPCNSFGLRFLEIPVSFYEKSTKGFYQTFSRPFSVLICCLDIKNVDRLLFMRIWLVNFSVQLTLGASVCLIDYTNSSVGGACKDRAIEGLQHFKSIRKALVRKGPRAVSDIPLLFVYLVIW